MLVIIEESLFSGQADVLDLLSIFQLALEERHSILTDPLFEPGNPTSCPSMHRWLETLLPGLKEAVLLVLEDSAKRAANYGKTVLTVHIGSLSKSVFTSTAARVTLVDGLRLLRTPLTVLLENRRNDGAFLRALAVREHRERLDNAINKGWLTIESSGGIEELALRIQAGRKRHIEPLRWWVLCDRDSGSLAILSKEAQKIEERRRKCLPGPLPYGALRRRMSENYLPLACLDRWAEEGYGSQRKQRREIVKAFKAMPESLRHRFHLKKGFFAGLSERQKDGIRKSKGIVTPAERRAAFPDATPKELHYLNNMTDTEVRLLQEGFGDQLRDQFIKGDPQALEDWIHKELPYTERFELIQSMLERI